MLQQTEHQMSTHSTRAWKGKEEIDLFQSCSAHHPHVLHDLQSHPDLPYPIFLLSLCTHIMVRPLSPFLILGYLFPILHKLITLNLHPYQ
jgi:hypothetical protein